MQNRKEIRKKANLHFFMKVTINTLLIVLGAVLISLFLRQMQRQTALYKQRQSSELALAEAVSTLEENAENADALSVLFHDGNQDMLDDLNALLTSGRFDSLSAASSTERSAMLKDLIDRSGVDYLYILGTNGKILLSTIPEFYRTYLTQQGLLSRENLNRLMQGTRKTSGVTPILEENPGGRFYFYSTRGTYDKGEYVLVLGANAEELDYQIAALKDVSVVLSRAAVVNDGFLFAVDAKDGTFLYYENGKEALTGTSALEAGLSQNALRDGYVGLETINGTNYFCVSRSSGDSTVICAVADTENVFMNDRYVLFWSIASFTLVMLLCLIYAVIVRNDFVRNAVDTKKKSFFGWRGNQIIFDVSIFRKVFPLMIAGVLLIFCISLYTQTLLEISQTINKSVVALDEVSVRYQESTERRKEIEENFNGRFLAKGKLLSCLLEEDPTVLNEKTDRLYSYFSDDGDKEYRLDDEGNRLKSVSASSRLQKLCEKNDLESIYIFDEDGRTIATSTDNWFFTISRNPDDQSYPFLQILDRRKDAFIQEAQINDMGEAAQYIGVAFNYYTSVDDQGRTIYMSRGDYEEALSDGETDRTITPHRSLLQIGLVSELSSRVLSSTEPGYIFSSNMLDSGFFFLFDNSDDHICIYSPLDENLGMTAEEMGISPKAFSAGDYYGFTRVNGVTDFIFSRYGDGYYIATLIPRSEMYQSRMQIALVTAFTSLILILFLSGTVTFTSEEEEMLYETISDDMPNKGLDSAIFNVILPSGHRTSTTKAAARWSNRWVPWSEKSPEQKLALMIGVVFGVLVLYLSVTVFGPRAIFSDGSVIRYILSMEWDRGFNIFALSACVLVLIYVTILIALLRIPVRIVTSFLGTRSETVGHLLLSVIKYGGAIGVFFYCLYLIGLDSTSLLASAGVLSLVIGLGAQSLIKDILAGIFIVFEGEFRMGDIVTIGGYRGTVMDIGLRTTKILGVDGNIKIYNNSEITGVLNMTKESSIAICKICIEYGQDVDYVEAVLRRDLPALKEKNPLLLAEPVYSGISMLEPSGVELTVVCKCNEKDILSVTRFLNKEILQIFYRNGIHVPFPNVTVSTLNMEGRKTIADFQDLDPGVSAWWDDALNETKSIVVTSRGRGMEEALRVTEQLSALRGLDHRAMLHLRLLAEELFGLLRGIAGDVDAAYWISVEDRLYELHMKTRLFMTREIRQQLLDVSTSGENAAAKGFMGRLRDMIFVKLLPSADAAESLQGTAQSDPEDRLSPDSAEEWTMSQYKSDVESKRERDAATAEDEWDELEKSIVARIADEVKVSMQGINVEITIFKNFP